MAKGDDIQERLIDFAVGIIQLTTKLAESSSEKHVAKQILRSRTSTVPMNTLDSWDQRENHIDLSDPLQSLGFKLFLNHFVSIQHFSGIERVVI